MLWIGWKVSRLWRLRWFPWCAVLGLVSARVSGALKFANSVIGFIGARIPLALVAGWTKWIACALRFAVATSDGLFTLSGAGCWWGRAAWWALRNVAFGAAVAISDEIFASPCALGWIFWLTWWTFRAVTSGATFSVPVVPFTLSWTLRGCRRSGRTAWWTLREVTFWAAYSSVVVPYTLAGTLRGASWTRWFAGTSRVANASSDFIFAFSRAGSNWSRWSFLSAILLPASIFAFS